LKFEKQTRVYSRNYHTKIHQNNNTFHLKINISLIRVYQ
jgi:hypothetical protein